MIRAHRCPEFPYVFDLASEIDALDAHLAQPSRSVPARTNANLLVATWNLTNFGLQERTDTELREAGLQLPAHHTQAMGTNLSGANHYDQIAFFPGQTTEDFTGRMGVYDFDNAVFADLDDGGARAADFGAYVRYYLADHRPLWAEFRR